MEAAGRTMLCFLSFLLLALLTGTRSQFIYIPSSVYHGVEGKPLVVLVETRFSLGEAEIQGTWSHASPSGVRSTLVTFNKESLITDMSYRERLIFREPNVSLTIRALRPDDEGEYQLKLNIEFHNNTGQVIREERTVHVTVDVPVSVPVIEKSPSQPVVEDTSNVTWTCAVHWGTRVHFQWLRDDVALAPSERHHFSGDNATLSISPVRKEDRGRYRCLASNPVSRGRYSTAKELTVYYGPYNLEVNSGQGLRTGEVFTINPGELAFFECRADSNPPNSYVWISKSGNGSSVIREGPRLEVLSYQLAQAEEYLCRAFNNVTQKQDEAQFTLVVASLETEKHTQKANSSSVLAAVTVGSLFIIGCMLLLFIRRTCHPKRVLMSIYNRPLCEHKRPHRSGHEDATEDFGIYEFVSIPGKMESAQASCRSLARLESAEGTHTIYDVIRHVPEMSCHSRLQS